MEASSDIRSKRWALRPAATLRGESRCEPRFFGHSLRLRMVLADANTTAQSRNFVAPNLNALRELPLPPHLNRFGVMAPLSVGRPWARQSARIFIGKSMSGHLLLRVPLDGECRIGAVCVGCDVSQRSAIERPISNRSDQRSECTTQWLTSGAWEFPNALPKWSKSTVLTEAPWLILGGMFD